MLLDIMQLRSTIQTKRESEILGEILFSLDRQGPRGDGRFKFTIGQEVVTTDSGGIKPGYTLIIKDREIVPGNWDRYLAGGMWHRRQDLTTK